VRSVLLEYQRAFAAQPPGAVLDGRDIGTVIVPQADVKIFLVASPEERARRRTQELDRRGDKADFEVILADIRARDERDTNRAVSPLKQAQDAHLLDTTHLDIDAAIRAAIDIVEATRAGRGRG
jgi:CMP/dCMP kinase